VGERDPVLFALVLAAAFRYHRGEERPRVSHRIARQRRG